MVSAQEAARALIWEAVPDLAENLKKPSRLYVILERHDKPCLPDTVPTTDSFFFVKGHYNLTIAKTLNAYLANYPDHQSDIALLDRNGSPVPTNAIMSELVQAGERLVVLLAREVPRESAPPTSTTKMTTPAKIERHPLQPVARQMSSTPRKQSDNTSTTPKRAAMEYMQDENAQVPAAPMSVAPPSSENAIAGSPLTRRPKTEPTEEHDAGTPQMRMPKQEPVEDDDTPFHQDNPFASDNAEDVEVPTRGNPLRTLVKDDIPERLEAAVETGLRVLAEIEKPLRQLPGNQDAQSWLAQIESVRQQSQRSRTVVGVVGNTGAGKSSVINALLEEERLVPTNCMRACTAVVTELSYNDSTDPAKKYRAEIEFIKPDDWEKDLRVLFAEIVDDRGQLSRDISNQDSEAAVAYSKIRAVYNKHTREMLLQSNVRSLMAVGKVQRVLGKIIKINEANPAVFYRRLQNYVDSKEKGTEKLDKNGNKITNPKREFECWPLIKVVRIYVKAAALSTGAVIVDLPGVHDSNAARAAVAEGYMKQTSGLWIVAPINRAVDDKAAKNLLGDSFKRQLKFDGTYSAVTFICSKTDDISRTEATDTLKLGPDMEALEAKFSDITLQKRELTKQLKESKSKKRDFDDAVEQIDEQVDVWEDLLEKAEDGKTVYAPSKGGKKRKSVGASERASKRSRISVDSDIEEAPSRSEDIVDDAAEDLDNASTQPLTIEAIEEKLDEFKSLKREARREKRAMDDKIRELQEAIEKLDEEGEAIDAQQSAICIAGRNEYSRCAIKRDFAAGIREIDEETAAEEDPENFNPDEAIRDYDEVAESLPVFCVSSRAYQKLSNRLKKDNAVAGFTSPAETEIPQLQTHCKKLTEKGRQAGCRRFLNSMAQLLNSLELWSSDDGNGVKLTTGQRDVEKLFLTRQLKQLDKSLEKVVKGTLEETVETLQEQLFADFAIAAQKSEAEASVTVGKWHAPRAAGGIYHTTYKATMRRTGVFRQNLNDELVEPIYKQIGTSWERVFQRRIPHILQTFTKCASSTLKQFHAAVDARCRSKGHGLAHIGRLGTQLDQYSAVFGDIVNAAVQTFNEGQRNINREFTPVIIEAMTPVYEDCASEGGSGMFMRMKDKMSTHIAQERSRMFQSATAAVRTSLLELCDTVRKALLARADDVYTSMQRDYLTIVGGMNLELVRVSAEERGVRRDVDRLIEDADLWFGEVVVADSTQLKSRAPEEEEGNDARLNEDQEEFDGADESIFIDSESEDDKGDGDGDKDEAQAESAVDGDNVEDVGVPPAEDDSSEF